MKHTMPKNPAGTFDYVTALLHVLIQKGIFTASFNLYLSNTPCLSTSYNLCFYSVGSRFIEISICYAHTSV